MTTRRFTGRLVAAFVALALLLALPAAASAQEEPPSAPPEPGVEPIKPSGEPALLLTKQKYEVLLISSDSDVTYVHSPGKPSVGSIATATRATAEEYEKAWSKAGYSTSVIYAPRTATEIEAALKVIAKKYDGKEATLGGVAIHYFGHGDDGVILTGSGNGLVNALGVPVKLFEIKHDAIGKAVANAFPMAPPGGKPRFEKLDVDAVFDACEQGGVHSDFRDALFAGRHDAGGSGVTVATTISSTRSGWLSSPRACWTEIGLFSGAFVANLSSPLGIEAAFSEAVKAQKATGAGLWQANGLGQITKCARTGTTWCSIPA